MTGGWHQVCLEFLKTKFEDIRTLHPVKNEQSIGPKTA